MALKTMLSVKMVMLNNMDGNVLTGYVIQNKIQTHNSVYMFLCIHYLLLVFSLTLSFSLSVYVCSVCVCVCVCVCMCESLRYKQMDGACWAKEDSSGNDAHLLQ